MNERIDDQPLYAARSPREYSPLNIAFEGEASKEYRDGWAFADQSWLKYDYPDLTADAPDHWSDEKAIGFWDRLALETRVRNKEGGPCTSCRIFTTKRDLGRRRTVSMQFKRMHHVLNNRRKPSCMCDSLIE